MDYKVRTIANLGFLEDCPEFQVDEFLWTCRVKPKTYGRMAYLPGQGLFVRMTSEESSPKRECKNHRDMVCKDSAVEAFFSFDKEPNADSLYFNFEVNANGAMYAKYGFGRNNREFLTDKEYALTGVRATIEPNRWTAELLVPLPLLERVSGIRELRAGDSFFCNFYKISEDPAIEHYAAWNRIENETPNFHMPAFFGRAALVD